MFRVELIMGIFFLISTTALVACPRMMGLPSLTLPANNVLQNIKLLTISRITSA